MNEPSLPKASSRHLRTSHLVCRSMAVVVEEVHSIDPNTRRLSFGFPNEATASEFDLPGTESSLCIFQTFVENASEAMKAQKQREKGQDVNNNNKRVYLRDPSPGNQTVT